MATVPESQPQTAAGFSPSGFQEVKAEGVPVQTAVKEVNNEEAVCQTDSQAEQGFSQTGFQPEQSFHQGGFQPVDGEKVQSYADQTGFQPSAATEQTGFQPQHDQEQSASNFEQKGFQPQPEANKDNPSRNLSRTTASSHRRTLAKVILRIQVRLVSQRDTTLMR
jgi:hypothetical protein